jgi:hypothetical protein
LFTRWIEGGKHLGTATSRTIKLLELYGETVVREAVAELLVRNSHDPSALTVLCEQKRRAHQHPVPLDLALAAHIPDRDVIPHRLEGYDVRG